MISGRKPPSFDRAGLGVSTGSRFPNPKKTQVGTSTRGETLGSLPSGYASSSRDEGNQLGTSRNQWEPVGTSRTSPCPNRGWRGGSLNHTAYPAETGGQPKFSFLRINCWRLQYGHQRGEILMPNPRIPAARAAVTGADIANPGRHAKRKDPKTSPLGALARAATTYLHKGTNHEP